MDAEKNERYGYFVVGAGVGLLLTYAIPEKLSAVSPGQFCLLPLKQGKKTKTCVGVFLSSCKRPDFACSFVEAKVPYTLCISPQLLEFVQSVSDYFLCSHEKMLTLVAPGFLWQTSRHAALFKNIARHFVEKEGSFFLKTPLGPQKIKGEIVFPFRPTIQLNAGQELVYQHLVNQKTGTFLLHGVTGAGKTEVYLKLAQHVVRQGRKVIVLVPEIALTPQMSARFRAVFQDKLALLHSQLVKSEYEREWFRVHLGLADVVLGVRTSVFCPLYDVGLIVVDEEHDASYKASDFPLYHARDAAVLRAQKEGALCVLGSATPSVESVQNVRLKKYGFVQLEQKFAGEHCAHTVIDARKPINVPFLKQKPHALKSTQIEFQDESVAPEILRMLAENKAKNEQSMVILNRRGHFSYALCVGCRSPLLCPRCSVTTTLHQKGNLEICHYCNFQTPRRPSCPLCGGQTLVNRGVGTQHVEQELREKIPELRVERLDRDMLTSHSRLTQIIDNFRLGHIDCLVGTQILAKGHDFPNVTLVVVLHVEDGLFLPDFRASERTFQLLVQAKGRAGRGRSHGKVVLQSFLTGNSTVDLALKNSVEAFWEIELHKRKLAFLPPFCRQILLEIHHPEKEKAKELAECLKAELVAFWQKQGLSPEEVRLAGPYAATLEKLHDRFRMQLCVSAHRRHHPLVLVSRDICLEKKWRGNIRIDVDPYSFL